MAYGVYYYDEQILRYLRQFVDLFYGLKVRGGFVDGEDPELIEVPIFHSSLDRAVMRCIAGGSDSETTSMSVPLISWRMTNIEHDADRRKTPVQDRRTYLLVEDVLEEDGSLKSTTDQQDGIKIKARHMPIPWTLQVELGILAENFEQHLQMLEQIMMVFGPNLDISSNDGPWDWTSLTSVFLRDSSIADIFPGGTEQSFTGSTFQFDIPIWISGPMRQDINKYVKGVRVTLKDGSNVSDPLADLLRPPEEKSIPSGVTTSGETIPLITGVSASANSASAAFGLVDITKDETGVDTGHIFGSTILIP
jgi:hypothetical protein